jgi:hypothetical protein
MRDLSTLEYLYDRRCCRASSDTHSCAAVSVRAIAVSSCGLQTGSIRVLMLDAGTHGHSASWGGLREAVKT